MALGSKDLLVRILADASALEKEMAKAEGSTKSLGSTFGSLAKTAVVAGGVAGIGAIAIGLDKSVKAALDAQQSTARLDQAFKNVGISAADSADQIGQAEEAARKLGFTDSQTRDALGSLVTATKDTSTAISDLSVAQDIARFKGVDLGNATTMLTTAMTGSQRAAKQLGIVVSPVTTAYDALKRSSEDLTTATGKADEAQAKLQDKMATGQAVIQAVTDKVHGQADAFAGTAAGSMEQFHAAVDHLEVSLGQGLLPKLALFAQKAADGITWVDRFVAALKSMNGELATATTSHVTAANSVAHTGATMDSATRSAIEMQKVFAVGGSIVHFYKTMFDDLGIALKTTVDALIHFHDWDVKVGNDMVAWANAVGRFASAIVHDVADLAKTVYDAATSAGSNIVSGLIHGFDSHIGSLKDHITGGVTSAWHAAGGFLHGSGEFQFTKYAGAMMADGVAFGFVDGIGNFGNIVSDNLDSQFVAAAARVVKMPGYAALAKIAAPMPTFLGDIAATSTAASNYASQQQAISDYSSQYLDTTFATPGYDPTMSAAQIYALGNSAPNVTVNVQGSVSTQQDLVKSIQAGLAQTSKNNVTLGIN